MSINLTKNKNTLGAAWHSVVDDKSSTNWAVFGYEGQSNNLKVIETGSGGLEEMIEQLDSSHIMYAFCRVIDNKTSLPKCLLINWQGEGAPIVRKGTCANHLRDVEKLLKGAHITITARSEDDVDVDSIMEKLARATASTYKFSEPRGENEGHTGPIGTTYRRVNPEQEINAIERDQFWQKEEMEEKKRLEHERVRCEKERQQLEEEIRTREEKESQLREQQVTAKENSIARQKLAEQRAEEANNIRNQMTVSQQYDNDTEDDHKSRSEELRRQRSKETQQLIAQRTINARAVFEQNSAAGQMKSSVQQQFAQKSSHVEAAKKAIEEVQQKELPRDKVQEDETTTETSKTNSMEIVTNSVSAMSLIENQSQEVKTIDAREEDEEQVLTKEVVTENELYSQMDGQYLYFDPNNEGMKARALYDYQAADDTEITFDPGDIITNIDAIDEGWWQGLGPDGTYGLFPANYVEVIDYNTT